MSRLYPTDAELARMQAAVGGACAEWVEDTEDSLEYEPPLEGAALERPGGEAYSERPSMYAFVAPEADTHDLERRVRERLAAVEFDDGD